MKRRFSIFLISILLINGCDSTTDIPNSCKRVETNYGKQIDKIAPEFDLRPEYLKALIILECSGKQKIKPRFEKHVFKKLKLLRSGKLKIYEDLKQKDIKNASDMALKNLASSWGPFQLMGYKCIKLGINVKDVRGENALYWGAKWIDKEYGKYLRQGKFEEAFRIHNTGKPNGKTHDPNYVKNGLNYVEIFKKW